MEFQFEILQNYGFTKWNLSPKLGLEKVMQTAYGKTCTRNEIWQLTGNAHASMSILCMWGMNRCKLSWKINESIKHWTPARSFLSNGTKSCLYEKHLIAFSKKQYNGVDIITIGSLTCTHDSCIRALKRSISVKLNLV